MSVAIRVENLGKCYVINREAKAATSLREQLGHGVSRLLGGRDQAHPKVEAGQDYWALRNVSFDVMEGERIGIIGANGAGKSTLLKILSRVTAPTEGRVEIHGRVASLLEVGTGFHPDLTGRENVFLSGAIMGMKRQEIRAKFDQIVEFSGVEQFIDTAVKHYSSGMYVRLAFAISAWLDPDILIVDEVLAVGDQEFQKKCGERMKELTREGRTVLFVSHSMATVSQMCRRALYLEHGRMVSYGPVIEGTREYTRDVIERIETAEMERYEREHGPADAESDAAAAAEAGGSSPDGEAGAPALEGSSSGSARKDKRWRWHRPSFDASNPSVEIVTYRPGKIDCLGGAAVDAQGVVKDTFRIDETFVLRLDYQVSSDLPYQLVPNFHIYTEDGERVFVAYPEKTLPGAPGRYTCECVFKPFTLNIGRFQAGLALSTYQIDDPVHIDARSALRFEVVEEDGSDPRRHGWEGDIPGHTRPRLDWTMHASS